MRNQTDFIIIVFLTLTVFAWGSVLRVSDQHTKDFWVDEVWRAQQIIYADDYQTLQEGDYYGMEAPVQYSEFFMGKIGLSYFGKSEIAFRIWPALFSVLSLFLFFFIATRFMLLPWALFSLALFAGSPGLIEHAHEFKPYSYEVLITLLLFLVIIPLYDEKERHLLVLVNSAFLGALTFLSTNIWPFVIPVLVFEIFFVMRGKLSEIVRKLSFPLRLLLFLGVVACLAGGLYFVYSYLVGLEENNIFRFWSPYYLDSLEKIQSAFLIRFPETMHWYVTGIWLDFSWFSKGHFLAFAMFFLIIPIALIARQSPLSRIYILILFLQVILSLGGLFPIFTRVGTFYYPVIILGIGATLDFIFSRFFITDSMHIRTSIIVVIFALIFGGLQGNPYGFPGTERHQQNIRHVLEIISKATDRGGTHHIFPNYSARLAMQYYLPPEEAILEDEGSFKDKNVTGHDAKELAKRIASTLTNNKTYWLLATHRIGGSTLYKLALEDAGFRVKLFNADGAYALRIKK